MRIAVIGSGVSGCTITRILSAVYDVTLFEANSYAGGHANTVNAQVDGREFPVDTGFMVFNDRTYPNFCQLLKHLRVESQLSDMSFSVRCESTGFEFQGSSLNGLVAQRVNALRPSFWRFLYDIQRFNQRALGAVSQRTISDRQTVAEFVADCGLGNKFVEHYLVPMAAAIWSSAPGKVLRFPARFLLGFFANHGLLQIRDRPQWRTIVGGSRVYIEALLAPLLDRVRLNTSVTRVRRAADHCEVESASGRIEKFDHVVFATHADQTLSMLANPTELERRVLSAFPYQPNDAILHTDTSWLPVRRRAWASWNYLVDPVANHRATVTYDLSRLQNHASPQPILLTLNPPSQIDERHVLRRFAYYHPAYSMETPAAQRRWIAISGRHRTHFCGAYWGFGFHEDGINSAIAVARQFGLEWESCIAASTKARCATVATSR